MKRPRGCLPRSITSGIGRSSCRCGSGDDPGSLGTLPDQDHAALLPGVQSQSPAGLPKGDYPGDGATCAIRWEWTRRTRWGDYWRSPQRVRRAIALNRTVGHSVEGEKRLDKEEKAEEKNGNNKLILIEKTGFITYRLSVPQVFRTAVFM